MVLIGIHSDQKLDEGKVAVKEWGITWPVALDTKGATMKAFGCDSFPDYVLVDRKGVVRYNDLANAEVDKAVEALIKSR